MDFIVLGGRLGKNISEELETILSSCWKDINFIDIYDCGTLNYLLNKKGSGYISNITSILIFDTSLESITEWGDVLETLRKVKNKDVILATRFDNFIPKELKENSNVYFYKQQEELSLDKFSIKFGGYLNNLT